MIRVVMAWMVCCGAASAVVSAAAVEHVEVTHEGVTVRATIVPEGAVLAHTTQLFPVPADLPANDAAAQVEQTLNRVEALLHTVGASLDSLARVNLYATTPQAASDARKALEQRVKCAISMVVTALPQRGALVALDAVAVATAETSPDPSNVRLLRSDRAVYISGMADKGDMADATRGTLAKLDGVLKHLGLTRDDVVQVKSFLIGSGEVSASQAELNRFFDGKPPPASWVEWTMKDPIEIELIVQGKPAKDATPSDTVSYINPPQAGGSPVFSRVAIVHGGRTIYTSGVAAKAPDAAAETRLALSAFRELVQKAGSDFEHLVKATYYPTNDAANAALSKVRPEFYNPKRPPAASKAPARHTGTEGSHLTFDLIAVTPPSSSGANAVKKISIERFEDMRKGRDVVVLDVRTPEEYREGHVPGAMNLDVRDEKFPERVASLDKTKTYLVYCRSGRRSTTATEKMKELGFPKLFNFVGSMNEWNAAGKPVGKGDPQRK